MTTIIFSGLIKCEKTFCRIYLKMMNRLSRKIPIQLLIIILINTFTMPLSHSQDKKILNEPGLFQVEAPVQVGVLVLQKAWLNLEKNMKLWAVLVQAP